MANECINACMTNAVFMEIVPNEEERLLVCRSGCNGFKPLDEQPDASPANIEIE